MSIKLYQNVIRQMKDAITRTIGVIDESDAIVVCSDPSRIGQSFPNVKFDNLIYVIEPVSFDGYTFFPVGIGTHYDAIVFVEGDDEQSAQNAKILSIALANMKNFYDEKYDKTAFIKNIILDNILPNDISSKSKELRIQSDVSRVVMLIRIDSAADTVSADMMHTLFPDRTRDFVITVNDAEYVLVKEVAPNTPFTELIQLANSTVDTIGSEFYVKASIGIGSVVSSIRDLARSHKEAQIALDVGKIFDIDKSVITYETLGIGRLIYQLPTTMCEMFLTEVFNDRAFDFLDYETQITIQAFFDNNLNVSETSRQLFIHRNTLVYRLEKIKKMTGLDLRVFDNAITFKVALMVKKYLDASKAHERS